MAKRLIGVCGPTASGKTAVAVELCRRIGGEVVSADSMQVYRGMDILSAAPDEREMGGVPHHMIRVLPPNARFNASRYREMASAEIEEIETSREGAGALRRDGVVYQRAHKGHAPV